MKRSRRFPAELRAVPAARRYAREAFADLAAELRDTIELLVSELATNSVKHARSPFTLTIIHSADAIRVEVSDESDVPPVLRSPRPTDPSGRGLRFVELLASRWGCDSTRSGKTVWFLIERPDPAESAPTA